MLGIISLTHNSLVFSWKYCVYVYIYVYIAHIALLLLCCDELSSVTSWVWLILLFVKLHLQRISKKHPLDVME